MMDSMSAETNADRVYDGLSPEARSLADELMPQVRKQIDRIESIPVAVLIWGPTPETQTLVAKKRMVLRRILRQDGNWACFSEELMFDSANVGPRIQEICQGDLFDLIVSLPASHGSVGEIHEFARDEIIRHKILVFVDKQWDNSYSNQSLRGSAGTGSYTVIPYDPDELENDDDPPIERRVLEEVQHIRYEKFLSERRKRHAR